MEVFYEEVEEVKDEETGEITYRHHFSVSDVTGVHDEIPFFLDEPNPIVIHLGKNVSLTAVDYILFGAAVLESKSWIEKTMMEEMNKRKKR